LVIRSDDPIGSAPRYRTASSRVNLIKGMKRLLASFVTLAAVACGTASVGIGPPLTVSQLKFRVIDQVGPVAYCDPDFYPLAHSELDPALATYPQIKADAELYGAIVAHEHLPAGDLTDEQKVVAYRAYKKLRALTLTQSGTTYNFDYTVQADFQHVTGTVRSDGVISFVTYSAGSRPNCPICLAASTLIATPTGDVVVTKLAPGMLVWTQAEDGRRIAMPVLEAGSTAVPPTHQMVHLRLADGRELLASPGHRTSDGRQLGALRAGDLVDGARVTSWTLEPYSGDRTYDVLPAGPTGTYWANGILLASTLSH